MTQAWTQDDAERIARAHVSAHGGIERERVFIVRTLRELRNKNLQPPALYGLKDVETTLMRSWLVYVSEASSSVLKNSWLVVVSKSDGSIKYSGSAHDEG